MPKLLRGYFPIMPTPYTTENLVDLESVRRLTRFLIDAGAQGMSPNGGDSEARHLSEDERNRVLDAVLAENAGRVPVLVGCSAPTTAESARLCDYAGGAGADAVFVMPPANWTGTLLEPRVSEAEMLAHYQEIAERMSVPLMIHATAAMSVDFVAALAERVPLVAYIKEETTFGAKLRAYVTAFRDRLVVFGPGLHYPAELEWGAQGVMPSCCGPDLHAAVFDLWQAGRRAEAAATWNRLLPLVFWRWHTAAKEAGKAYLRSKGVFTTTFVRPTFGCNELGEADLAELRRVVAMVEGAGQ